MTTERIVGGWSRVTALVTSCFTITQNQEWQTWLGLARNKRDACLFLKARLSRRPRCYIRSFGSFLQLLAVL